MSSTLFCEKCAVSKEYFKGTSSSRVNIEFCAGYLIPFGDKISSCPYCGNTMLKSIPISNADFLCIRDVSNCNTELLEAMIKLRQDNIIEYESKMSQFRTQVQQQENSRAQAANTVKCPRCGSTNITAGQRGFSLLTGFVGSGKTVNRCANCGHKWRP